MKHKIIAIVSAAVMSTQPIVSWSQNPITLKYTSVDTSLSVQYGYSSLIYLNNKLYNTGNMHITIKWKIDSIKHNFQSIDGGICTEICYPTSVTSKLESIRSGDSIPLKAYFTRSSGFIDSGTATMFVSVFDTTDSAGTFTTISYTMHLSIDSPQQTIVNKAIANKCIEIYHNHSIIANTCHIQVHISIVSLEGKLLHKEILEPYEKRALPRYLLYNYSFMLIKNAVYRTPNTYLLFVPY